MIFYNLAWSSRLNREYTCQAGGAFALKTWFLSERRAAKCYPKLIKISLYSNSFPDGNGQKKKFFQCLILLASFSNLFDIAHYFDVKPIKELCRMMVFPDDLLYSREHTWARVDGNLATIGITDYAQDKLGEILHLEMPSPDSYVETG